MRIDKSQWKRVNFGDVVTQCKETIDVAASGLQHYIAGEHMSSEDIHIRQWGTVGDKDLGPAFHRKFEKGNILYGSRRTYLKKVAVAHFDGITSNTTFVLQPNEDLIDARLVPFLMLSDSFTHHSVKNSKGSVNPYINYKDIAGYTFLLPPEEEQEQLAELLWAGDEVLERYGELEIAVQSTMNSAYQKFFAQSSIPTVELSEIAEVVMGQSPDGSTYNADGVGMPLLNGPTEFTERYPQKIQWTTNPSKKCKPGDVLLCVRGSTTGRMNIANDIYCIGRGIAAIRGKDRCETDFLEHILLYFVEEIKRRAVGSTFPNIDGKNLRGIMIPNYSPSQQQIIAGKLNAVALQKNEVIIQKDQSYFLQKHLINQIFTS